LILYSFYICINCVILLYLFLNRIYLRIISRISLSLSLYTTHFLLRNLWNNKLQEAAGDFLRSVKHFLNTKQTALVLFLARQILISTTHLYACLPLIDACLIAAAKRQKVSAVVRRAHARNFVQNFASVGVKTRKRALATTWNWNTLKWRGILPGARAQQCE